MESEKEFAARRIRELQERVADQAQTIENLQGRAKADEVRIAELVDELRHVTVDRESLRNTIKAQTTQIHNLRERINHLRAMGRVAADQDIEAALRERAEQALAEASAAREAWGRARGEALVAKREEDAAANRLGQANKKAQQLKNALIELNGGNTKVDGDEYIQSAVSGKESTDLGEWDGGLG